MYYVGGILVYLFIFVCAKRGEGPVMLELHAICLLALAIRE